MHICNIFFLHCYSSCMTSCMKSFNSDCSVILCWMQKQYAGFECIMSVNTETCLYQDRPAGNTRGCRTERRRRIRPTGRLSGCSSDGKVTPDHTTHCTDSRTSRETEHSRLQDTNRPLNPTMHLTWDQLTDKLLRCVFLDSQQSLSSEPSAQSLRRSHLLSKLTHSPLQQLNCLEEQSLGTRGRWEGVTDPEDRH